MRLLLDHQDAFRAAARRRVSAVGRWLAIAVVGCSIQGPLRAAISVRVGEHVLLPNAPGQFVDVQVTGGNLVSGIDLFAQVGDGGPGLADFGLPPGLPGPAIRRIDLKSGTIFAAVTDPQIDLSSPRLPQVSMQSLSLIGSVHSVPASGRLARVEVDTTGFFQGSWTLKLTDVLPFDDFSGPLDTAFPSSEPAQIFNGMIRVDPGLCDSDGDGRCDPLGDLNSNLALDAGDIDSLSTAIHLGRTDRMLDLNDDRRVDDLDRRTWVQDLKRTYFGDANLDGQFNSSDFVAVFQAGEYEDRVAGNSGWATGDWNGDREFNSADLVRVFQEFGYDQGPRPGVAAVPEPQGLALVVSAIFVLLGTRRPLLKARINRAFRC